MKLVKWIKRRRLLSHWILESSSIIMLRNSSNQKSWRLLSFVPHLKRMQKGQDLLESLIEGRLSKSLQTKQPGLQWGRCGKCLSNWTKDWLQLISSLWDEQCSWDWSSRSGVDERCFCWKRLRGMEYVHKSTSLPYFVQSKSCFSIAHGRQCEESAGSLDAAWDGVGTGPMLPFQINDGWK